LSKAKPKMDNVKERPGFASFNCPNCNVFIVIAPVFRTHHNTRYEAWAKFWFQESKTGRGLCKVIYEGQELAPATAAQKITGYPVNGWKFWRYEDKKGVITLDELASGL